ncbi:hypothetical protein APHAL10511_005129 [Amanita phalloides]|nr:hypothetical protein APHAL10511_005129 [Amanita phalloides]
MNIVAYRTIPVTLLISTIYISIFFALLWTDSVPDIPKDTHGLDLEQAYADLHHITTRPHPYHSHANDIVRSYIRERIDNITSECDYAHVKEDSADARAFWLDPTVGTVIFHPSNIMVKIDGYDDKFAESGGVLFSAHYDSVSTAFGATDDGISVVSLLQLIEHLVKNRPRRTAVFNINNGEEDGLNGAQAFIQHPWSSIPDTFINLEGAGAGGSPLLFRATSLKPVKAYGRGFKTNSTRYRVSHPHGNVMSADAFQRGVVRSRTDYSIYHSFSGMEGIDLAFYKRRSRYHTMFDSIPGAKGEAKRSLWAMLESVWATGGVLLNIDSANSRAQENSADVKPVVYFDLFKKWFIVFEQRSLHVFNLVFLLAGPAVVLILHAGLPLLYGHFDVGMEEDKPSLLSRFFAPLVRLFHRDSNDSEESSNTNIVITAWSRMLHSCAWANIWIPTVLFVPSILALVLISIAILNGNRYITYSRPYTVMLSYLSTVLIVVTFLLGSPAITARLRSPRTNMVYVLPDRQATLLHLYAFTYILLILAAVALSKLQIGGLYWISLWHSGVCAACIVGGAETFYTRYQRVKERRKKKRRSLLRRDASRAGRSSGRRSGNSSDSDEDAAETTPLLPGSLTLPDQNGELLFDGKDSGAWWIFQVLLSVPVPVVLIGHVLLLFQGALGQTLSDGSSAAFVYAAGSMLCFFIVLPIAPFASGIHRYVTYIAIIAFLCSFVFNLSAFPFSQETPLKVLFQQSVRLDNTNHAIPGSVGEVVHAVTTLTGVEEFVADKLVSKLPSSWNKELQCVTDTSGRWTGLVTCSWESGESMIPYPGGTLQRPWLAIEAQRLGPTRVRLVVQGKNTRACRVYLDEWEIVNASLPTQGEGAILSLIPVSMPPGQNGSVLRYWTREWGKKFAVELDLNEMELANHSSGRNMTRDDAQLLRGRVACEWAEYESGMIGMESNGTGFLNPSIPALEEVFRFLPQWAVVSKAADGLVEAWSEFTV